MNIAELFFEWFIGTLTLYNKNKNAAERSVRLVFINYFLIFLSIGSFCPLGLTNTKNKTYFQVPGKTMCL